MSDEVDPSRFPSLSAYLAALPAGLDSYPEAQSKGSLVRSSLEGHDSDALRIGLPEALRRLLDAPPPAGVWVPAVYSDAIFHAVADRFYPTDTEVVAWTERRTASMAKSPMYAAVLRVPGPSMLLRITARVHDLVQRGTTMTPVTQGNGARLHMAFPPHLHARLNLLANVGMIRGLIQITGGKNPKASMISYGATKAEFECSWTP